MQALAPVFEGRHSARASRSFSSKLRALPPKNQPLNVDIWTYHGRLEAAKVLAAAVSDVGENDLFDRITEFRAQLNPKDFPETAFQAVPASVVSVGGDQYLKVNLWGYWSQNHTLIPLEDKAA